MADPVMSDFPLRKVLECIPRDFALREDIVKHYSKMYPMEAWIRFSDRLRRAAFNERKEEEIDKHFYELAQRGYIIEVIAREHPSSPHLTFGRPRTFYRLTRRGIDALASVKKK